MPKFTVELVKYDMDKTKKRKRADLIVEAQTEQAVIDKLEKIHKGEKVVTIHEIKWGEEKIEQPKSGAIQTGTIKFFDEKKGFGFVQPDGDKDDLFFHASALGGQKVDDRDAVQFQIGVGPKGSVAVHIKLLN